VALLALGWNSFGPTLEIHILRNADIKALVFLNNFQVFLSKETICKDVKAPFVTGVFFRHKIVALGTRSHFSVKVSAHPLPPVMPVYAMCKCIKNPTLSISDLICLGLIKNIFFDLDPGSVLKHLILRLGISKSRQLLGGFALQTPHWVIAPNPL
jgi:hypothetical protein